MNDDLVIFLEARGCGICLEIIKQTISDSVNIAVVPGEF
jgi:hypothetical protein